MRWSWLRAALLGVVIGPAPLVAEAEEAEPPGAERLSPARPTGHSISGPGFYVWDEDARVAADWAVELVRGGRDTPEAAHWRAAAAGSAARPSLGSDALEAALASWVRAPGHDSGLTPLGSLLCLLPSLDRTCLIASWATAPDEPTRRALAGALAAPFEAVGVRGALEYLERDPSAAVRRLARAAAASRHA